MIEKLKALEAAATPRPFAALLKSSGMTGIHAADCVIYHATLNPLCLADTHERQKADAGLLAALRNLAPELIGLWEACEKDFVRTGDYLNGVDTAVRALNAKAAEVLKD